MCCERAKGCACKRALRLGKQVNAIAIAMQKIALNRKTYTLSVDPASCCGGVITSIRG